jgi:hypothetical protein
LLWRGDRNKALDASDATEALQIVPANNCTHAKANQIEPRSAGHICLDEIGKLVRENLVAHLASTRRKRRRKNRPAATAQRTRHRLHFFCVVFKAMNEKNRISMWAGAKWRFCEEAVRNHHTKRNKQAQQNCSPPNAHLWFEVSELQRAVASGG